MHLEAAVLVLADFWRLVANCLHVDRHKACRQRGTRLEDTTRCILQVLICQLLEVRGVEHGLQTTDNLPRLIPQPRQALSCRLLPQLLDRLQEVGDMSTLSQDGALDSRPRLAALLDAG